MSPIRRDNPPAEPTGESKKGRTAPPPEVMPASSPSPEEPSPAKPPPTELAPPVEPAPEKPAPGTPPETPPKTPEAPPAPPAPETRGRWESIKSTFKGAYDRFLSKFRGEAQPEEEKDYKGLWGDIGRNVIWGLMGVVASYTGVKFLSDLSARAWQDLVSNPAERKRIHDALLAKETELGETTEPSAIDQKKAKLEEAINASKFLTKEKKAELLSKLYASVDEYEKKDKSLRDEREVKIVALLKDAIQTRVKNTQLLKEGVNAAFAGVFLASGGTALWAQGLRGPAFSLVAIFERHKEVMQSPERRMQYVREMTVRGFTDTLKNLAGGDAKFFSKRGVLNAVKGATNVLRAVGFTSLTIEAFTGNSLIDHALDAGEKYMGIATPDLGESPTDDDTDALSDSDAAGSHEAADAAEAAGAAGVAVAESTPSVEIPEATIEAGLVKKGDGILKILQRQGVEAKAAMEAAREAGIVRAGGDTRLTTEAIGRLSIFTETQPDGDIEIKFFDTQAAKPEEAILTLEEARKAGFTYESSTDVPEPATVAPETSPPVEPQAAIPPESEISNIFKDSLDVPNNLLNGTFHIYTDSAGNLTSIGDEGDRSDFLFHISDALEELDNLGNKNSSEYQFLLEQKKIYENTTFEALYDEDTGTEDQGGADTNDHTDKFKGNKYKGEEGKVIFKYDKKTGEVTDAFIPAPWPRYEEIKAVLKEWDLDKQEVKDKFLEKHGGVWSGASHPGRYPSGDRPGALIQSAANDYRLFTRDLVRLSRQESLLNEMVGDHLQSTPEYQRFYEETQSLRKKMTEVVEKEFPPKK